MKLKFLLASLALAACGSSEAPAPTDSLTAEELAAGKDTFAKTCVLCHGAEGRGDGDASAGFDPKPRDLSDAAWQDSVDDEYISKIIQYGGGAVGKSPAMPATPLLKGKPKVLKALVAHVRSLKK